MEYPVDKARRRVAKLRRSLDNNEEMSMADLEAVTDSNINREMKKQGFRDLSLNPLDYINDNDVTQADIIEASMRKVRAENIEQRTRDKVAAELSNTPTRQKLRKWEAETILELQKQNSGGVR